MTIALNSHRNRIGRLVLGAGLAPLGLMVLMDSGLKAQPSNITMPEKGVVCDGPGQVCYDQQGVSIALTKTYFGHRAERDLLLQFNNRPFPQEFRLSNASVCSVTARTCWSDGWSRRTTNQMLTAQLFGSGNQVLSRENGYCRLDDWGVRAYNGRCRLIRTMGDPMFRGDTYKVRINNRPDLVFGNRNGVLIAFSGGRSWPAQFENQGNNTAVFRWGTQQLLVNTLVYGANGSYGAPPLPSSTYNTPYRNSYSGTGVNWNGAIEGLLNGLFR